MSYVTVKNIRNPGKVYDFRYSGFGNLGALPEEILASVQDDAASTQEAHKRFLATMAGWEEREPGKLTTDDDLRRTFSGSLSQLEQEFVLRNLKTVGIEFPYQLDRTNPAHAIILAVRDDIKDTVRLLDSKQMQFALAKEIREVQRSPLIIVAERGIEVAGDVGKRVANILDKAVDLPGKALDVIPYIAGAAAILGLVFLTKK